MRVLYLGIDPGVSGGIAVLDEHGEVVATTKMLETERDVFEFLDAHMESAPATRCYATLEHVRATPQMGVVSAFTFGRSYGMLRMALLAAGIAFEEVAPIKWQNAMKARSSGDKNITKARAQELFPGARVTHAVADALLLAEYGRRKARGILA